MNTILVPWTLRRKRVPVGRDDHAGVLQRQVNRLFNDFVSGSSLLSDFISEPLTQLGERWGAFTPNVNVTKRESALVVAVEVPGMDERDIEISLTREGLTIRGERKQAHEDHDEKGGWRYVESSFGAFERMVPLGDIEIEEDKVEATSSKGIVTITLPFKSAAVSSPKKVTIRAA